MAVPPQEVGQADLAFPAIALSTQVLKQAVNPWHHRLHLRHLVRLLAGPFATVARALNNLGLGRLRNLDPKPPVQRFEREQPGDLIHIDVKKLARFRKVGHRIISNRQQGCAAGDGYDRVHVAIDDSMRVAYVEVLAYERKATTVGVMVSAVACFKGKDLEASRSRQTTVRVISHAALLKRPGPWSSSTSAPGPTPRETTAKLSGSSRPTVGNGTRECRSRTQRNAIAGCPASYRSITVSGRTVPSAAGHLNSASTS
jgi:hypothetical protein